LKKLVTISYGDGTVSKEVMEGNSQMDILEEIGSKLYDSGKFALSITFDRVRE